MMSRRSRFTFEQSIPRRSAPIAITAALETVKPISRLEQRGDFVRRHTPPIGLRLKGVQHIDRARLQRGGKTRDVALARSRFEVVKATDVEGKVDRVVGEPHHQARDIAALQVNPLSYLRRSGFTFRQRNG